MGQVFLRVGCGVQFFRRDGTPPRSLQAVADEGVRRAYRDPINPLRATMVADPLGRRTNTRDNTPAVVHCEIVDGESLEVLVVAKGGGGDVKARFATLNPGDSVADWVIDQLPGMGLVGARREPLASASAAHPSRRCCWRSCRYSMP